MDRKPKKVLYGEEARNKLKAGVDKIANAVTTTLGPKGRNVAYKRQFGYPQVVHDGVTVAKQIELKDEFEDIGAQLARQASERTNDNAGDGTTTAMLLAQKIVEEGVRNVSAGTNPMAIRSELEKASEDVVNEIRKLAKPIKTKEEKKSVATISAQDEELGELIAEAMAQVGDEGVITVEESRGFSVELEYKEGVNFDNGFASPYFVTNPERMEAVIEGAKILLINRKVDDMLEFADVLNAIATTSKNIVVIANDYDDNVLASLVMTRLKGGLRILAVKAPEFGDVRKDRLGDIAVITGGNVISEELGREITSITVDDLGSADRVISTKDTTTIIGGGGDKQGIKDRVTMLKAQRKDSDSDFDIEKLTERLAMLTSGIAVISVGGATESEVKEKKLRVEDAVNATKAAVEEGIVVGGGVALLRAREILKKNNSFYESLGAKIIYDSLSSPLRKIVENAGIDGGEVINELRAKEYSYGYNVKEMKYEDLVKKGIIDPAKVVIEALRNAVSVGVLVLSTDCIIVEETDDN